jgi:hypothetical protein
MDRCGYQGRFSTGVLAAEGISGVVAIAAVFGAAFAKDLVAVLVQVVG